MKKALDYLVKKVGWESIFIISLFFLIYAYAFIRKRNRIENCTYVKGVSIGIEKGMHGSHYLHYSFDVDNETYDGNVPASFCNKCSRCCMPGDTVIVQYENGNPKNNDLVLKIPE